MMAFDNVSYSDEDEETVAAAKAAGSDPTAKKLGKIASRKDEIVKAYRNLEPQKQDKIAKAKAGDKEAADWLKNTWTPILKAYNKAQQVNV
jgi:DnaJ-domain-containing protein 1